MFLNVYNILALYTELPAAGEKMGICPSFLRQALFFLSGLAGERSSYVNHI